MILAAINPLPARSISHEPGLLLDTNVPSELTRLQPEPRVAQWLEDTDDDLMYLSVISIGEICKGFTGHPEQHRRTSLRHWLKGLTLKRP